MSRTSEVKLAGHALVLMRVSHVLVVVVVVVWTVETPLTRPASAGRPPLVVWGV